jgi:hypothetical protein
MKALLEDLTIISKKLGVYEYRFGVTSEQMFVSNKQIDLFNSNSPIKSTVQEWRKCYEDYICKISQIETKFTSLNQKSLIQPEARKKQENNSTTSQMLHGESLGEYIERITIFRRSQSQVQDQNQAYMASDEDRGNLIEIRLPIGEFTSHTLKDNETEQTIYALDLGKIIKHRNGKLKTYSVFINLQKQNNRNSNIEKIVSLKDGNYLNVSESINYQNCNYPIQNVRYRLEASNEFWDKVTGKIQYFTATNGNPEYFSLSLFTSNLDIDESKYKIVYPKPIRKLSGSDWRTKPKLEDNNLVELETPIVELEIPIKVEKFCISQGIYWLPEAGQPIDFEWQINPYARFGCLGHKIYPITRSRAGKYNQKSLNSRKWYASDTPEHRLGNIALQNVKASLERLQGVTAWESPPNSRADEEFKWDLFFSVGDKVYPLQIKSSLGKAEEALSQYQQTKLPFIPPIIWVNPSNSEEKARKLVEEIAKRFSNILGISLSDKTSTSILFLQTVQNRRSSV